MHEFRPTRIWFLRAAIWASQVYQANKSQYFRRSRRHNWTSEHWYYGKIYGTPRKVIARAIKHLIGKGKIKRRWVEQDGEDLPFWN